MKPDIADCSDRQKEAHMRDIRLLLIENSIFFRDTCVEALLQRERADIGILDLEQLDKTLFYARIIEKNLFHGINFLSAGKSNQINSHAK